MKWDYKNVGIFSALFLVLTVGMAATSSTRLNDTVIIGLGGATTKKITFDNGNGASEPLISANTSNQLGINTASPGATLEVDTFGGGSDVTTFMTRAASATGIERWEMYPSSGSANKFEFLADFSTDLFNFQSASQTIFDASQAGQVSFYHSIAVNTSATPNNALDVSGPIAAGTYTGTAAPANGFIVSGAVGIGTYSPSYKLEVDDTSGGADVTTFATRAGTPTGTQRWYMLPSSGTTPRFEIDASNTQMVVQSDSNNLLTMTHAGLVGLSMTPSRRLDVAGDMGATGSLTLSGTGGNTPHGCTIRSDTSVTTVNHTVTCSTGEIVTGGGCRTNSVSFLVADTFPSATNQWECNYNTTGAVSNTVYAVCCSI